MATIRALLTGGVLMVAVVLMITAAIVAIAPYLAIIIVLLFVGWLVLRLEPKEGSPPENSK